LCRPNSTAVCALSTEVATLNGSSDYSGTIVNAMLARVLCCCAGEAIIAKCAAPYRWGAAAAHAHPRWAQHNAQHACTCAMIATRNLLAVTCPGMAHHALQDQQRCPAGGMMYAAGCTAAERITRACYRKQSARCYECACTLMPAADVLTVLANALCCGCAASMPAVAPYHSTYVLQQVGRLFTTRTFCTEQLALPVHGCMKCCSRIKQVPLNFMLLDA
jgi:hypothetical protein